MSEDRKGVTWKMYYYFVVYGGANSDDIFTLGNIIYRAETKIESLKNGEEMIDWIEKAIDDIKKEVNLAKVTILNYSIIERECENVAVRNETVRNETVRDENVGKMSFWECVKNALKNI